MFYFVYFSKGASFYLKSAPCTSPRASTVLSLLLAHARFCSTIELTSSLVNVQRELKGILIVQRWQERHFQRRIQGAIANCLFINSSIFHCARGSSFRLSFNFISDRECIARKAHFARQFRRDIRSVQIDIAFSNDFLPFEFLYDP